MASPYLVLALDTAGRLDRELTAVSDYLDDPAGTFCRDVHRAFLLRSIEAILATARAIRQQLLDAVTRNTESTIEIQERAVRSRTKILMRALQVLVRREHEVPRNALIGRFQSVQDVYVFLVDQVVQIHGRWMEQRDADRQLDADSRGVLAYSAVDDAEIGFERLGRDTALATFLRVGAASECEPIRTACREIAATLDLHLVSREQIRAAANVNSSAIVSAQRSR